MSMIFPENFLWGAATSAYQIEGSPLADGAGVSNWHHFSRQPGTILGGDHGDVACDHYRRWREDVALMADLGIKAYRFSVAWSRVQPSGRGAFNPPGLGFYERLTDALLAKGIEPCATLYHWDHPQVLDDLGGWANPDMPKRFGDYAEIVLRALDDRVKQWFTLNEPWVVWECSFRVGTQPPGLRSPAVLPYVARHLMQAHDTAMQIYREHGKHRMGLVVNLEPKYPASERDVDQAAAIRAESVMNRLFLDPIFFGTWPEALRPYFARWAPEFDFDSAASLKRAVDFIGINYYSRAVVRDNPGEAPVDAGRVRQNGAPHTDMDWEVYPAGLRDILVWFKQRYGDLPLYVTENGAAFPDPEPAAGSVADRPRVAYLREHLRACHEAIATGVDLRGYFAWSLMDNFEWTFGYARRFGLVRVAPPALERIPKQSALFYQKVIERNGVD